jgi:acyl carrier protein
VTVVDVGKKVRDLTGAHTRVVWVQQQAGGDDWFAGAAGLRLMGIDSDDGKGVREIVKRTGSFANPMITPSGTRVIYTDNPSKTVHVVDFSGRSHRVLCKGYAVGVWIDPSTGIEWVYTKPNNFKSWSSKSGPVDRRQIDKPRRREMVWTKSSLTFNYFQLSPDGKRAAACLPWPQAGIVGLPDGHFKEFGKGCWTNMAPDSSYRMWVFDLDHRHVKLFDKKGNLLARIRLNDAPGIKGWEIFHPRWSNNLRIFTVTGPWSNNSKRACPPDGKENLIPMGGTNVELYIGRFNRDLTGVESWVKITSNTKGDFHGHAWVERSKAGSKRAPRTHWLSLKGDSMASTTARVKTTIAGIMKIDAKKIDDGANLVFDLGLDSLQFVNLVAALEQEFGVEMDEDQAAKIESVQTAAGLIDRLKARKKK